MDKTPLESGVPIVFCMTLVVKHTDHGRKPDPTSVFMFPKKNYFFLLAPCFIRIVLPVMLLRALEAFTGLIPFITRRLLPLSPRP